MRKRHLSALAVAVALVATGCGSNAKAEVLDVAGRDFAFTGLPARIGGGKIDLTFRNEGKVTHEFAAIRIGDLSYDAFAKGFGPVLRGGPFPAWMTTGAAPAHVEPGKTLTTSYTLQPGRYMFFCGETGKPGSKKEGPPHYKLGMRQVVDVEGDNGIEVTAAGGTFTAQDYTFLPPSDLTAGKKTYVFRNAGPKQWHFMYLGVFKAGVTPAKAEKAFGKLLKAGENAPPPKGVPTPHDVTDTGIFAPGLSGTFEVNLLAGRTYIAACFLSDRTGGPPHAIAHHMYKAFAVS